MRIAVTGGAGFIGSHLVSRLAESNAGDVIVIDNLQRSCREYDSHSRCVTFYNLDIRDRDRLSEAIRGCDVVFHLAAQSSVIGAVQDEEYAFTTNVTGTVNVLRAAASAGARRVVFTSSREVYGAAEQLPVAESSAMQPLNAYGASKAAGEMYCYRAAHDGLETAVLRLANVYGPLDRDRVIPLFAEAAMHGSELIVYGFNKILDFIWVGEVVEALLKAGLGPWIRKPVNIGSGKGVKLIELAQQIIEVTGSSSTIRVASHRAPEVDMFIANVELAKSLLGISPPENSLSHLQETIASLRAVSVLEESQT